MAAAGVMADFPLPASLEAAEPPEARGLRRDEVRLLVSDVANDSIEHARFHDLPRWLSPGDLLVVNTSGTLNAALAATSETGEAFELHLSTQLPGGFWTVEVRRPRGRRLAAVLRGARAGTTFACRPAGAPRCWRRTRSPDRSTRRLACGWRRSIFPVRRCRTSSATAFRFDTATCRDRGRRRCTRPCSRPSQAAPRCRRRAAPSRRSWSPDWSRSGVQIAPLLLHTGVASLENHEPPYEEFFRVPRDDGRTCQRRQTRGSSRRGRGHDRRARPRDRHRRQRHDLPGEGWTSLVITPDRPVRSVSGLITGLHDPRATHLTLLEAGHGRCRPRSACDERSAPVVSGSCHLERAYAEARQRGYLWHEFGDSHLILGRSATASRPSQNA